MYYSLLSPNLYWHADDAGLYEGAIFLCHSKVVGIFFFKPSVKALGLIGGILSIR